MRTFVLLCTALAVLQTVTAMSGYTTTSEGGSPDGPPPGWPETKEDCEKMTGGYWQDDLDRCESEDLCHEMKGWWGGDRCWFGETATTTSAPGHHHSTTNDYWKQRQIECLQAHRHWHWNQTSGSGWCDYNSYATTPYPGHHHSTTNDYWRQRQTECHNAHGHWHWNTHGDGGWCEHTSYATTRYPGHHHSTTKDYNTEHSCEGNECCGEGTQFDGAVCVPTYEGVMDACRNERKEWGWTCEASCPANHEI